MTLHESIDIGLKSAKKGIAILSQVYFQKFRTKKELNALFAKSTEKLTISQHFSLLASENTVDEVARQFKKATLNTNYLLFLPCWGQEFCYRIVSFYR